MKIILFIISIIFLTGCEDKQIIMQDVEKVKYEAEQK